MHARDMREKKGNQRTLEDVIWFAGQDIRRTWPAYPASALYLGILALFFGLSDAMAIGTYSFEFVMIAMALLLATPFFAREYMSWWNDPIAERLAWLRVLPIGVPTIVRGRALAILAALPLNAVAFFIPVWFGGAWEMSTGGFLWFCAALVGVSLVGAGVTLALEMGLSIRRWVIVNIVSMVLVIIAMLVIGLALDIRIFEQLSRAVAWNGPMAAVLCLAGGAISFFGCVRLAEDLLRRRELEA